MTERSLIDGEQEAAVDAAVDQSALAEVDGNGNLPAPASLSLSLGEVSGEVDSRDLIVPKLEIVQKVGILSESYDGGCLILNKDLVLAVYDKKEGNLVEDVELTVLSIHKYFEEVLPFDPNGPRARTFDTFEELKAAGLWTEWLNDEKPPAREVANSLVLIKKPENLDSLAFSIEYQEDLYTLALWTTRSTAYRMAAKKILSAAALQLKVPGLLAGLWTLQIQQKTSGGNQIFVPDLKLAGRNDDEFVSFMKTTLS